MTHRKGKGNLALLRSRSSFAVQAVEKAPASPRARAKTTGPARFFNRELSWLRFNQRVLEEAADPNHPLLERLKFLSIFSSNLDEFYMIRVAGVKEQVNAGINLRSPEGFTPTEQLRKISQLLNTLIEEQSRLLTKEVLPALRREGVRLVTYRQLKAAQRKYVDDYFREKIFPILTPLAIDPAHPFPKLRSLNLNLWVELESEDPVPERRVAVVPVPALLPRFIRFEEDEGYTFILIEKVIAEHLDMLFQHLTIARVSSFRVTRNADLDISEAEADDLLKLIERELRKRRLGTVIRLEVSDDMPADGLGYLREALGLERPDVYRVSGPLGVEGFFQLIGDCDLRHLKDEPFTPVLDPQVASAKDIFEAIRKGDIILHHPYESFAPVVELLEEAARDPKVLAIKQTLYRTGGRSNIVAALKEAVERGKQVTALVELKARFDEETNITWARELERAGVNVVYGMMGLKTHSKLLLVIRQEDDGLRHYVHLSTGNYNERTAKIYTDVGLLTCDPDLGADVLELFNVLTGYSRQNQWRKLFVAPLNMRQNFQQRIDRCIEAHSPEQPSHIQLVMNSLVDPEMIEHLYRANAAGVRIDLIVRGICCLVPGVPGQSEHITVRSIVGRFLEHTRLFVFSYGGQHELYAGSADWMPRNLDRRIETVFPIERPQLQDEVREIIRLMLTDNVKARVLQPDGTWQKVSTAAREGTGKREPSVSVQEYFLAKARKRQKLVNTIPND